MMNDVMTGKDAEGALKARRRFVALAMLWLLVVGGGGVVLGAQAHGLGCDSPTSDPRFDSTVGAAHFRWWPLGVECVYTRAENGVDRRNEPGPVPSAWALFSVVLSIAVVGSFRATRRDEDDAAAGIDLAKRTP
jgi:hypothetical protein